MPADCLPAPVSRASGDGLAGACGREGFSPLNSVSCVSSFSLALRSLNGGAFHEGFGQVPRWEVRIASFEDTFR